MKKPPLIPSLIVLAFVVLMINLGFWQLNRAEEKEQILTLLADDRITLVEQTAQIKNLPEYANVVLRGHYLNSPQLLLDNQVNAQQLGYHVFTPFVLDEMNLYIMVNRGWVAKDNFKEQPININSIENQQDISIAGKLNHSPQVGIQLGEIELNNEKTQQIITYFDRTKVSKFLHESLCSRLNCIVSDRILMLNQTQDHGFKRDWQPIIMPPSKHIGYAVQWFSMTFVLIIIFIYWLRKL